MSGTTLAHAVGMAQARQWAMAAHLVTPRWKIAYSQNLQSREQVARLDAQRSAKIFKAENITAAIAGLEPVSDFDEVAATLAFLAAHVSQVASNRVFQNGKKKLQLAFDNVIAPDQVGVLAG